MIILKWPPSQPGLLVSTWLKSHLIKVTNMNPVSPKKLLHTKWTAVVPINKEKHFIISRVTFDEAGKVDVCELEAVLNKRVQQIDWRDLKDSNTWRQGWK